MDRIEKIIANAFQYERTQVTAPHNHRTTTWWPPIVREYSAEKWATSPDPDSYPVDGVFDKDRLGDKEVYDFVQNKVFPSIRPDQRKILVAYLQTGCRVTDDQAGKILALPSAKARMLYMDALYDIKKQLTSHEITIYFLRT